MRFTCYSPPLSYKKHRYYKRHWINKQLKFFTCQKIDVYDRMPLVFLFRMVILKGGGLMGKVVSIVGGIIAMLLGIWGIVAWWVRFLQVLQGSVPVLLIFGGAIALFLGISEIRDQIVAKKEEKKQEAEKKETETK